MCSISEGIIEMTEAEVTRKVTRKVKKDFAKRIIKLFNDEVLTIAQAAEALDISEEEFISYMS